MLCQGRTTLWCTLCWRPRDSKCTLIVLCFFLFFLVHERELVVGIACFETSISESDIIIFTMIGGDSGFVNDLMM